MAELSALAPINETIPVAIKNYDGTDTGIVVHITSPLSPAWQKRKTALFNLKRAMAYKAPNGQVTGEQELDFENKSIASLVMGWDNLQENGKDMLYTEANAERIVANYPLFAQQLKVAMDNQAAFFTKAHKASATTQSNTSKRTKKPKTK
jgi:hypothetical protein